MFLRKNLSSRKSFSQNLGQKVCDKISSNPEFTYLGLQPLSQLLPASSFPAQLHCWLTWHSTGLWNFTIFHFNLPLGNSANWFSEAEDFVLEVAQGQFMRSQPSCGLSSITTYQCSVSRSRRLALGHSSISPFTQTRMLLHFLLHDLAHSCWVLMYYYNYS